MHVLVDQVGYELHAPKQALVVGSIQDHPHDFVLIGARSSAIVLKGNLAPAGQVNAWDGRVFWTADFSSLQKSGDYVPEVLTEPGEIRSCNFEIAEDVLERNTLSNVVFYFKGQRSSGLFDQADRHLPVPGGNG